MPRTPSNTPPLETMAFKADPVLIADIKRYCTTHGVSVSDFIRDAVKAQLYATPSAAATHGNTALPAATAAMLARLATTLTTTADEVRQVVARTHTVSPAADSSCITVIPGTHHTSNELIGDTGIPDHLSPDALPSPATIPAFDPAKYRLGRLCKRGHDYYGSGQTLYANNRTGFCIQCNKEYRQSQRQHPGTPA